VTVNRKATFDNIREEDKYIRLIEWKNNFSKNKKDKTRNNIRKYKHDSHRYFIMQTKY
jgi:hypothetical protein